MNVPLPPQRLLEAGRIAAFHHDEFVESQLVDFTELLGDDIGAHHRVVDIGGGVGHFAAALAARMGCRTRVVDVDQDSVSRARARGLDAEVGDAVTTRAADGAHVATLNLILHHLVAPGFGTTARLQASALANFVRVGGPKWLFVNEYIYESFVADRVGAALIYGITASPTVSAAASTVARAVPSLQANTFGVGVRFRTAKEWLEMFRRTGWQVARSKRGPEEQISLPRRLAFGLRSIRRDSFLLERA